MATVQSMLDSARYDLRDYETGLMWDDTEILNYLNRMVGIMDSQLAVLNSDLVEAEELDIDCVQSQNYVDLAAMNSGDWDSIRQVWIGQNIIYKISVGLMRYKRMFRSSEGRPYYYALSNRTLLWDYACPSAYTTLAIYYNKKTAVLTATDDMPYDDIFNEFFRSQLSVYSKMRAGLPAQGDSMDSSTFRKRAMEEVIRRGFNPRPYYIDF